MYILSLPIVEEINIKKAFGFDRLTCNVLQYLSKICYITLITFIYNALVELAPRLMESCSEHAPNLGKV